MVDLRGLPGDLGGEVGGYFALSGTILALFSAALFVGVAKTVAWLAGGCARQD